MPSNDFNIDGLTDAQVIEARNKFGSNILVYKKENAFINAIISIAKEPMVIILLLASTIYFISGKIGDGIFLSCAVVFEMAISLYQVSKSRNTLEKLKSFSQPFCKVIRNGVVQEVKSDALVVGDSLLVEEGMSIPADATIVHANDFSVNESVLTGEALSVNKNEQAEDNKIYHGTLVASGLAVATITEIGNLTKLGKIGKTMEGIKEEMTPLEYQINNFVKKMIVVGTAIFIIVWGVNYFNSRSILDSLLKALTLALSILPEEIPVALTSFMAIGAWRMMKMGIVVKQVKTIETLGSATVICTDKTGTITENNMSLARLYSFKTNNITELTDPVDTDAQELLTLAMWASEPVPFDPMELALHSAYGKLIPDDERQNYKLVHEYPLEGTPPMMTHVFENAEGKRIVAAKGAPEALLAVSKVTDAEKAQIEEHIHTLAKNGYRLLAVGEGQTDGSSFPDTQQAIPFHFIGVVAFYDPPKENIKSVLEHFYKAGIQVKIITGDNAATTTAIAEQIGFKGADKSITGTEVMELADVELAKRVTDTQVFTRMFPDAKLKVVNALKANHEIVAMVGDGVNDGLALKAAHIGIAMGKKGTEIAKQAASLILMDDDLKSMVDAVAMGRRIYANLKKAIQYIISIHIPIVLIVFIPLALRWLYPNIFSPVHIIFLELIMGPTCSIIFENEPIEKHAMSQKPRAYTTTFFNWKELTTSIIQGLVITIGLLLVYQYAIKMGYNEATTRTMVFGVLITANIFLTLVNRSFFYPIWTTIRYKNRLVGMIIGITIAITALLIYVPPIARFFEFIPLNVRQLSLSVGVGCLFVVWYEVVKGTKRLRKP